MQSVWIDDGVVLWLPLEQQSEAGACLVAEQHATVAAG
jgi:hypothetical protein